MIFLALICIPLVAALVAFFFPAHLRFVRSVSRIGSLLLFLTSLLHASLVLTTPDYAAQMEPLFHFDVLGALMMVVVCWVFLAAMIVSDHYLDHEKKLGHSTPQRMTAYYGFAHLFVLAMVVTLVSDHMILMWIALEASTLATTLLVAYNGERRSLEAAWKYIVLCSVGLLIGLFGILMFSVAVTPSGTHMDLRFSEFASLGFTPFYDPLFLKIAFILILIGFGTKVGLVPMHNWLPDAHGETPAPISAILSGVLLSVTLVVLVRFKVIVDGYMGGSSWTNHFFIAFALLSIVYAALLMLNQGNYKRLLAYSSIEHMGLATFGFALGPIGIGAAFLHIAGHALIKPILFFASGEILHTYHTASISGVRGLSSRLSKTWVAFLLAILGLVAMPPSALFLSEFLLITEGARVALFPTIVIGLALVVAAYGLLHSFFIMTKPAKAEGVEEKVVHERWNITHVMMALQGILLVVVSVLALSPIGQSLLSDITQTLISGAS